MNGIRQTALGRNNATGDFHKLRLITILPSLEHDDIRVSQYGVIILVGHLYPEFTDTPVGFTPGLAFIDTRHLYGNNVAGMDGMEKAKFIETDSAYHRCAPGHLVHKVLFDTQRVLAGSNYGPVAGRQRGRFIEVDRQRIPNPVEFEHLIERYAVGFRPVSVSDPDSIKRQGLLQVLRGTGFTCCQE